MTSYYRVMAGQASAHAQSCFEGSFIGVNFDIHQDLTFDLEGTLDTFTQKYGQIFLEANPGSSKIAAGLACSATWTLSKLMVEGDVVLTHDGRGTYRVGAIAGPYSYEPGERLPHRRPVQWRDRGIVRADLPVQLRNALGAPGTVSSLAPYSADIVERLREILLIPDSRSVTSDFYFERQLRDFLVTNWSLTELGTTLDIYEDDLTGRAVEYRAGAIGVIDILAVSKDGKRLVVVELKRGRASDAVVGQALRYMGYVQTQLARKDQLVEGIIIGSESDEKLRMALIPVPAISFYEYEVQFTLRQSPR